MQKNYRDFTGEKPASDEIFRAYRSLYAYDKTALNPVVESIDDSSESWRKEKVSFDAAYGKERSPPISTFRNRVLLPIRQCIFSRRECD